MSTATRRATRLVSLRQRVADRAKSALANASSEVARRREIALDADRAWSDSADQVDVRSVAEAIEEHELLAHLSRRRSTALEDLAAAQEHRERSLDAAIAAQRDLRRFELWMDGLARREEEAQRSIEQRATDEVAARRARR